jgi:hypothetical protein
MVWPRAPCQRTPPAPGQSRTLREKVTRVTEILRCVELQPHQKVSTPPLNLNEKINGSGSEDQDTSPFQLEQDVWLGGSDFQLRAVVIGQAPPGVGRKMVPLTTWQKAPEESSFGALARKAGRVGLAQAEYFFDVATFADWNDQNDPKDTVEWLWNQGWVARLRSFRLRQDQGDGAGKTQASLSGAQSGFLPSAKDGEYKSMSEDCGDEGSAALKVLKALGDGEEP